MVRTVCGFAHHYIFSNYHGAWHIKRMFRKMLTVIRKLGWTIMRDNGHKTLNRNISLLIC